MLLSGKLELRAWGWFWEPGGPQGRGEGADDLEPATCRAQEKSLQFSSTGRDSRSALGFQKLLRAGLTCCGGGLGMSMCVIR